MISWMYHVADMFRLMPIVVATGVYILDTCALDLCNASSRMCNQKDLYPLMTMTALNTAVKCHETKMFPLDQLVHLMGSGGGPSADQSYTPNDITLMERRLLHRCGWKLHCPTTHDYLLRFATILKEEYQGTVIAFAVTHIKESLLWEHVLHQEKHEEGLFSTCTLAYAAFLIAMEDAVLPLADKQAACLVLLEVSGLSAETPKLPEAYNWLYQAKLLQTNLEEGNKDKQATTTISSNKVIPAHACIEPPQQDLPSDSLDDQMISDSTSSEPSVVEPNSDDQSEVVDDNSTSIMSHDSSIFSEHSIIFFSSSSDGDAVEVVATDIVSDEEEEDDDDDDFMDHSATASVLPTVVEDDELVTFSDSAIVVAEDSEEDESEDDEVAKLVLSESLDEDGFEVAFESKNINTIASLVTSPREVSITL